MQPRSLIFKVASPLFYQPGQGKARLHPSSTSYRLARQLTPTNAQARKGVRYCPPTKPGRGQNRTPFRAVPFATTTTSPPSPYSPAKYTPPPSTPPEDS